MTKPSRIRAALLGALLVLAVRPVAGTPLCGASAPPSGLPQARLAPARQAAEDRRFFREIEPRSPKAAPSIVKVDARDNVWVALARVGKIGRFGDGEAREYDLPANAFPVGLAIDPEGQVWFSDIRRNKICRLDPATGEVREHDVPTPDSWPFYIVIGHDGKLYFTERMGNRIGRLDPVSGEVTEIPVPTPHSSPAGMAVAPDGLIYFTENAGNKVGRLDPATGEIVEIPVPTPMIPSPFYGLAGIAADAEGNIWFAEVDGRLGRIRPGSMAVEEIPLSNPAARPAGVAVDAHGVVWLTELDGNAVTSYDPRLERFRRYQIPTGAPDRRPKGPPEATARGELPVPGFMARTSRPFGIAVDSRGRVWFSEQYGHKVGVLTPPEAEIFAPAGTVTGPAAEIRVQVRPAPGSRVVYRVDGREVPVSGRLDLRRLAAGPHELSVEVLHPGGRPFRTASAFHVRPDLDSVAALAHQAEPGEIAPDIRDALLARISAAQARGAAGERSAFRAALHELLRDLASPRPGLAEPLREVLLTNLRHVDLFGSRRQAVESAERLEVEVGDAVTFAAEAALHGPGSPFVLAAEEEGRCVHTFLRDGEYRYRGLRGRPDLAVAVRTRGPHMIELPLPGPDRVPGVLAVDRDGGVWYTAGGGGFLQLGEVPLGNRIGRVSPDGSIVEYETPTPESGPTSIAVAPDGRVWFTERAANQIGVLDPRTGAMREYPVPTPASAPTGIAVAPDGRVWYAAKQASRVGVLDPASGRIAEHATPSPDSQPSTITADAQGNIWFDERANDRIVRLDPKTGEMREYGVPTRRSRVVGLAPDPRGYVWFLELGANKVGRLHVETGAVVEHAVPTPDSSPFKLALDPAGRVWFTQVFGNKIGVLDHGRFYELALPAENAMPGGIAIDERGNVWFSEQAGNKIGMIPRAALAWSEPGAAQVALRSYEGGAHDPAPGR